jgi:hypothetical protein
MPMLPLSKLLPAFLLVFQVSTCCGQSLTPVTWTFSAMPLQGREATLVITAGITAGWHLYSQSIRSGGPIPTRIKFTEGNDYILRGTTVEKGDAASFYDDTYEMEITWYQGVVTYLQPVILTGPTATIKGSIAYMTCNSHVCVPGEQPFIIRLPNEAESGGRLNENK